MAKNIAMVGSGYVGLVSGSIFADWGNDITCIDSNPAKIKTLKEGKIPIYEPDLERVVQHNIEEGRLHFTTDLRQGIQGKEMIFICVGTPPEETPGSDDKYMHRANLVYVAKAADGIARYADAPKIVIDKSTVPAGTGHRVHQVLNRQNRFQHQVVSCPEFLKEGTAVEDCLDPDRVVVGGKNPGAVRAVASLYDHLDLQDRLIETTLETAEMSKLASNAYLAISISFVNLMARICDQTGADITEVARIMRFDQRIGENAFLNAGIGFGGSCFPKDVQALYTMAADKNIDTSLLRAILEVNETQVGYLLAKINEEVWTLPDKKFGILGLAFKGNTDDTRESRAIELIDGLIKRGVEQIRAHDPQATENAQRDLQQRLSEEDFEKIHFCSTTEEAITNTDVTVIATDWPEFKKIKPETLKEKMTAGEDRPAWVFEGRHTFDPKTMLKQGFLFYSIGRPNTAA